MKPIQTLAPVRYSWSIKRRFSEFQQLDAGLRWSWHVAPYWDWLRWIEMGELVVMDVQLVQIESIPHMGCALISYRTDS